MGQNSKFFNVPVASPNEVTSEQLQVKDNQARIAQNKDTSWKKTARTAFDNTMDAAFGFLGLPGLPESKSHQLGELVSAGIPILGGAAKALGVAKAGLPFAAYAGKGVNKVFHGTQRVFDTFDPSRYDKGDVLGWLTHFAENPEYANQYAMGATKGMAHIQNSVSHELELPTYFSKEHGTSVPIAPKILPAHIDAKNVLDLVDPNTDDLSQALGFLREHDRKAAVQQFKQAKRDPEHYRDYLKNSHYPNKADIPNNEVPARITASGLRLDEDATNAMPFDAIRYHDASEKSWAVPEKTPIKSIFGAPLNKAAIGEEASPIKMVRDDNVSTGMFPVLGADRSGIEQEISKWLSKGLSVEGMLDNVEHGGLNLGKFSGKPNSQAIAKEILLNYGKSTSGLFNEASDLHNVPWNPHNITNPNHDIKTPYIVIDNKTGKVLGGSGDKSVLLENYDGEDIQIVPNHKYELGNGDDGKPFVFSDTDHDHFDKQYKSELDKLNKNHNLSDDEFNSAKLQLDKKYNTLYGITKNHAPEHYDVDEAFNPVGGNYDDNGELWKGQSENDKYFDKLFGYDKSKQPESLADHYGKDVDPWDSAENSKPVAPSGNYTIFNTKNGKKLFDVDSLEKADASVKGEGWLDFLHSKDFENETYTPEFYKKKN